MAIPAFKRSSNSLKTRLTAFFVSVVVLDVLVFGAFVGVDKVIDRIQATKITNQQAEQMRQQESSAAQEQGPSGSSPALEPEETVQARVSPAYAALNVLREKPWFGVGGKNFQWFFPAYKDEAAVSLHYEHAHNDYIENIVEGGLIGFSLQAIMGALVLMSALKVLFGAQRSRHKGLILGLLMAVLMTAAHCFVDFPTQIFSVSLTLTFIAVALLNFGENQQS